MTFGLEMLGAFLAGIGFTIVVLAVSAKPLMRWSMNRMMRKAVFANKPATQPTLKVDEFIEIWHPPPE